MIKRAVLYARVSGDDRKYATSGIKSQLNDCRMYAEGKHYQIVGEYYETPEKQTSGIDWLPKLDEVIRLAHQKGFDVLVVREMDRLARNRFKQMSIENKLGLLGINVEYVVGQFEDTAEGRLMKGLVSEFAEYEREKIRERTRRGKERSVQAGNVTIGGSYAPYGYDLVKEHGRRILVFNEGEAKIVILIFDLYVNCLYSLHAIADYLDEHHIPKPAKGNNHKQRTDKEKKKGWSIGTLNNILNNETYVGRWYYRKTRTVKDPKTGKSRNVPRPRSEWLLIEVPAIIGEDVFKAAQKRRAKNKQQMGKNHKHTYLLGGMIQCGHCGNNVSGVTKVQAEKRWGYYKCNAHHLPKRYGFRCDNAQFKVKEADNTVWQWVKATLLSPVRLKQALENHQQQQAAAVQPLLNMIEANKAVSADLRQQKARLIAAYQAGVLSLDEFSPEKVELDKQINELSQAIENLQAELELKVLSQGEVETIESYAAKVQMGAELTDDDPETQREILRLLDMQVKLSYVGGQRWADVVCILGENHLAADSNTTWSTVRKSAR